MYSQFIPLLLYRVKYSNKVFLMQGLLYFRHKKAPTEADAKLNATRGGYCVKGGGKCYQGLKVRHV